jgi:aldehyde dehydrogenase (NAD+)
MPILLRHYVAGAWLEREPKVDDRNPAHPDEVVAHAPVADAEVIAAAALAARGARADWARTPALARGEILFRAAELLARDAESIGRDLAREEGKTLAEGIGETRRAAAIVRYFAAQTAEPIGELYGSAVPGTQISVLCQPLGVVAAITPWNFPIAIPAWKIAPALAFGNTVLFKPATATPLVASRLVEAFHAAGLPPGVLNLVFGAGPDLTDGWIRSGAVAAVSFTGSAEAGAAIRVAADEGHAKVQLELGGKNAVVVDESADIERAAELIVRGAMASAGQKCTATSRVIAHAAVAAPLRVAISDRVARLQVGDPLVPTTGVGPVIDAGAQRRIERTVQRAVSDGARLLVAVDVPADGWFSRPTVLDDVDASMAVWREEVFGPVVSILDVPDLRTAIRVHNDSGYGLSGSIFTRDLAAASQFIAAAQVGLVHVNGETAGAEPHVPFGGMKGSSSGSREQGKAAQAFYTQIKTVYTEGLPIAGLFDDPPGAEPERATP